ncbi:MAG: FAD-binding protein [Patescibacteria group bacterium]
MINDLPQIDKSISLAQFTSLKVGGLAENFAVARNQDELVALYLWAKQKEISVFVLGGGTNVLISDDGIRGLVIKNEARGFVVGDKINSQTVTKRKKRNQQTHWRKGLLNWDDLSISQSTEGVAIEVQSGHRLPLLLSQTLQNKITGLELFAGIPGTVGGAVWNNIHGADWFIGDFLESVKILNAEGSIINIPREQLELEYNDSFFHRNNHLILSVKLNLFLGDTQKAQETALEWIKRKAGQPKNSAGSTFSNLTEEQKQKAGLDNLSAGYVIDKVLNLRGYTVGGAKVSESHANFIETKEGATAKDVLTIINYIKKLAQERLGADLKEEIVLVGEF